MKQARHRGYLWALVFAFCSLDSDLIAQNQDPVLVGAGDIADCTSTTSTQGPLAGAQQTANLVDTSYQGLLQPGSRHMACCRAQQQLLFSRRMFRWFTPTNMA